MTQDSDNRKSERPAVRPKVKNGKTPLKTHIYRIDKAQRHSDFEGEVMRPKVAAPAIGDTLIVQIQTKYSQCMELSGYVEEVSEDYVYFSMDAIHLTRGPINRFRPVDGKTWRTEHKPLRMGVHLNDIKLFTEVEGDVVWLVNF